MIILPDRNIPRARILMPVPKKEWMAPSLAQPKDQFGRENKTFFCVRGRLDDGHLKWRGIFDDREDFDAFIYSIFTKRLKYERALWKLSRNEWHPDLCENLKYDFATETALTSSPGSTLTYTSPSDWNNSSNSVKCLGGAGGGGAAQGANSVRATGGGGGGYAETTNFTFATPGTTTASYSVGAAGTGVLNAAGNAGGNTWFSATTTLMGGRGGGGQRIASSTSALSGGTAGAGSGSAATTTYSGGRGGNISAFSSTAYQQTGGGGGAGPNGAGGNGGDKTTAADPASAGGTGDNGTGGTGSAADSSLPGNPGTEWGTTGLYGSGGGGGAALTSNDGGLYGAGGGGYLRGATTPTGGDGQQGLIYIMYTPGTTSLGNLPMLGM